MSQILKMTVPGNPEFIQISKNAVMNAAALVNFDVETIDEIGIAVYEACKNISCHGYDGWCKHYDIDVDLDGEQMTVMVSTEAAAHDIQKLFKMCLDCPKDGDLSMAVISSIMDDLSIEKDGKGGKRIKMVKRYAG